MRRGQSGNIFIRHGRFVGRYYVDQQDKRVRKAVTLDSVQ